MYIMGKIMWLYIYRICDTKEHISKVDYNSKYSINIGHSKWIICL